MANGRESEEYVAEVRPVLLSGTGTPPLRNIVTSATYAQRCCMQHLRAHIRRDYIKCAAGQDTLEPWRDQWLQRIGGLYLQNLAALDRDSYDI